MISIKTLARYFIHSIGLKIAGLITLLVGIISITIYIMVPKMMENRSIEMTRQKAESISEMTAYSVRAALDFMMIDDIENAFRIARQNKDIAFLVLKNEKGRVVHDYNYQLADSVGYSASKEGLNISEDGQILFISTPITLYNRNIGELIVGLSLEEMREDIHSFKLTMIIVSFLIVVFGIASALFISRFVTKPLNRVVKTFDMISRGDLTRRAEVLSKDELGHLAESFNIMVESLEFTMSQLENANKSLHNEIGERKKAELELRKLNQAIIQSPVSIIITNVNKIIEYVNPKFSSITGIQPEEIIGTKSDFLIRAESDPHSYNDLWNTLISGNEWRGEFQNIKKNGELIWEIASISPIRDPKGNITHFITVREDITQRKKLEESSSKYAFIVNTTRDLMSLVNRDFEYEAVNKTFCSVLNLSREQIIGKRVKDIWGSRSFYPEMKNLIEKSFEGEENKTYFIASFDKAGSRHLELHFYPYYNQENKISHCSVVAKDVTEQKNTEIILKESEGRYRELVSRLPDMVVVQQMGKVLYVNSVVRDVLGFKEEEVIGENVINFIAEEYREKVLDILQRRSKGEDISGYEVEILAKDGSKRFVEIRSANIVYDHKPATLNVVINITDRKRFELELRKINEQLEMRIAERTSELLKTVELLKKEVDERKVAEESLRDSEERFRALAEYSNDVIMRFDKELRHLYVNQAVEKVMGRKAKDFMGHTHKELRFSSEIIEIWTKAIRKVFETKEPERVEFQTDEKKWIDLMLSPEFSQSNEVKTVLTSARDITELKQKEIELTSAKERALEASRLKSEFLANMSHEIRTPMNAIIGFTDVLTSYITDKKQRHYLNSIKTAGKSLLTLINDILDLSKIEAGKMELLYEPVNPYTFIKEIQNIFSVRISEKDLDFIINVEPDIPESLLLDEVRLRQVLFNLIGNAVKFTDRGSIKLTLKNRIKNREKSLLDLILSVEDTGSGIAEDSLKLIFEAFQQERNAQKSGGTGLGLAITKRLVEMMGGEISVSSQVGKGSCFDIILYNVSAATTRVRKDKSDEFRPEKIKFKTCKVLIVDDIKVNRDLLKEFFRESNINLAEAENGKEAIKTAGEFHPDLILMDIRMPVMDGYEAVLELKKSADLKHIPVIAVTASAMKEDRQKIDDHGFEGYLMKPVHMEELVKEMIKFLDYYHIDEEDDNIGGVEEDDSSSIKLNKEEVREMMAELDKLKPLWEKANKSHFINDVLHVAKEIRITGEKYNCEIVSNYGAGLEFSAGNFDIEKMTVSLASWPEIIRKLESHV